jgi:hypothetical protein
MSWHLGVMFSDEPHLVGDVRKVEHLPSWRGQKFCVNFLLLKEEPTEVELLHIYTWARERGLENARVISPHTLLWSSLFQPRFFEAMNRYGAHSDATFQRLISTNSNALLDSMRKRIMFWAQSVVFLASVTLSAAIVQGRASTGTIASKFDKLWQMGQLAEVGFAPELIHLELCKSVTFLSKSSNKSQLEVLLELRSMFDLVIQAMTQHAPAKRVTMVTQPISNMLKKRFRFVDQLRKQIPGLKAIVVYGSSISSNHFADYDAILSVENPDTVLSELSNTRPSWQGKELNLGVYSPDQLWRMQLLSGDNLADYGICILGEAELPEKPTAMLLARNMSFGMVRLRQQLGMIGPALLYSSSDCDDRRNLFEYFVKIPANIAKGTFGAVGQIRSKEDVAHWLSTYCSFDASQQQSRIATDGPAPPLAAAAIATGRTLKKLNEELEIVRAA